MNITRVCKCAAYPWPHEFGLSDCGDRLIREAMGETESGDDYAADQRADDPRRGQSQGLNALRRIPE